MKKSIFLSVLLLFLSVFCFASCASGPSYKAAFAQDEFVFSLGERVDFFDKLSLSGIDKADVSLSLLGNIAQQTENQFEMINSGRGVIAAKANGDTIASAAVVVKAAFERPANVVIDDEGRLTWEKAFAYFDGEIIWAKSYTVWVDEQEHITTQNSYDILPGTHQIKVRANAIEEQFVDQSPWSNADGQTFEYGQLGQVTNVKLTSYSGVGSPSMKLSWTAPEGSGLVYDVIVDGVQVAQNTYATNADVSFLHFAPGSNVAVTIIAKSNTYSSTSNVTLLPSSYQFNVTKLATPSINFDQTLGRLSWQNDGNYSLAYVDKNYSTQGQIQIEGKDFTYLEGVPTGIYEIRLQAKNVDGQLFADSNIATIVDERGDAKVVGKLPVPEFSYQFEDEQLVITVQPGYSDEFILQIGQNQTQQSLDSSRKIYIPLSQIDDGQFDISLVALPNRAKNFSYGSFSTDLVVRSDPKVLQAIKLAHDGEVIHQLVGANSVLSLAKIENTQVEDYSVALNGQEIPQAKISERTGQIRIEIDFLEDYTPDDLDYNFTITVKHGAQSNELKLQKTVSILPKMQKAEREDNSLSHFYWQSLGDAGIEYRYKILHSSSDFVHGDEVAGGQTAEMFNPEELAFGYYYIEAEAISVDTNLYLDANFGEKFDGTLREEFFVTKQIEGPNLKFYYDEDAAAYKLQISDVEYARKYQISLDGEVVGLIDLSEFELKPAQFEYTFTQKFLGANGEKTDFEISVVAKVGLVEGSLDGDGQIHPDSDAKILTVTRLGVPTFELNENQELVFTLPEGAKSVIVTKQDEQLPLITEEGQARLSAKEFVGTNLVTMQYLAQTEDDYHVFLDSSKTNYNLIRLDPPYGVDFNDGILTFQDNSGELELDYKIKLILDIGEGEHSYQKVYQTEISKEAYTAEPGFDLGQYIQSLSEDFAFQTDFNNAKTISVSVCAYKLGGAADTYYLPSDYSDLFKLEKLEPAQIQFDTTERELSWESVGGERANESLYQIYIDGEIFKVAENDFVSGNTVLLKNVDFLSAKTIQLRATNPHYIAYSDSNVIVVKQLAAIEKILVKGDQVTVNLPGADINQIQKVAVNDQLLDPSQNVTLSLTDFASSEYVLQFMVQAVEQQKNDQITYYYISSEKTKFTFVDISTLEAEISHQSSLIELTHICESFLQEENPLKIYMNILNQGEVSQNGSSYIEGYQISLDDPRLLALNEGNYNISFMASFSDYYLTCDKGEANGYFGTKSFGQTEITKIAALSGYTYKVSEVSSENKIERRRDGGITIFWDDIWDENVLFDIKYDQEIQVQGSTFNLSDILHDMHAGWEYRLMSGDKIFSLGKADGKYQFELSPLVASYFSAGQTAMQIKVRQDKQITSNATEMIIKVLESVENAQMTPEGKLQFDASQNATLYLIQLSLGGSKKSDVFELEAGGRDKLEFDLWDEFKDYGGVYTVDILADDVSGEYLPSRQTFVVEGYRLKGFENVTIDQTGKVIMTISDEDTIYLKDLMFELSYNDEDFQIDVKQIDDLNYYIEMLEIVELLKEKLPPQTDIIPIEFELYLHKSESVNSQGSPCKFNYQAIEANSLSIMRQKRLIDSSVETDKSKDFLVLTKGVENTCGIWIEYHYFETPEDEDAQPEEKIVELSFVKDDIFGYWITNDNGEQYFESKVSPSVSSQPVLAFCINDILKELGAGEYTFYLSRIVQDGDEITQFGTTSVTFKKLEEIDSKSIDIKDRLLTWQKTDQMDANGYYINFYTLDNDQYNFVSSVEISDTTTYDLTKFLTKTGIDYYLAISTISNREGLLASNETRYTVVSRYQAPASLEVVDGRMQFKQDVINNMTLLSDISENYSLENGNLRVAELIANKTYISPFTFTAATIMQEQVQIQFSSAGGGGQRYYLTMRALDLIAPTFKDLTFLFMGSVPLTYIQALYNVSTSVEVQSSPYANNVRNLLNAFNDSMESGSVEIDDNVSKYGLASDQLLFDDFGNIIPDGVYNITIRQNGHDYSTVTERAVLPSEYSNDQILKSVTQEPELKLSVERQELKNVYYLSFRPVQILDAQDGVYKEAAHYILNIRQKDAAPREFDIWNNDGLWHLDYNDPLTRAEKRLALNQRDGLVEIDLSNEFRKVGNLSSQACSFSIYAKGNDFAINGKTDTKMIAFLEFDVDSLQLKDGKLSWDSKNPNGTVVTYKFSNQLAPTRMAPISGQAMQSLILPYVGKYDYVSFFALGGINSLECEVDSPIYGLLKVFKRYEPTVDVNGGIFKISPSRSDGNSLGASFNVSNDVEKGLRVPVYDGDGDRTAEYLPYQENPSDVEAKIFYITSAGTNLISEGGKSHFVEEENDSSYVFDCKLVANPELASGLEQIVLESEQLEVKARMLTAISNPTLEDGDIKFESVYSDSPELVDSTPMPQDDDVVIGYQVIVRYFAPSTESSGLKLERKTRIYYTLEKTYPTWLIENLDEEYRFTYSFTITPYPFVLSSSGSITTIENTRLEFANNVRFDDENQSFILKGQDVSIGSQGALNRLATPENLNFDQENQVFKFTHLYEGLSDKVTFKAIDQKSKKEIKGQYNVTLRTLEDSNTTYRDVTFKPDQDQMLWSDGEYKINIVAYYQGAQSLDDGQVYLSSSALSSTKPIYKLEKLTKDLITFDFDPSRSPENGIYIMSFEQYFQSRPIASSTNLTKIVVKLTNNQDSSQSITTEVRNGESLTLVKGETLGISGAIQLYDDTNLQFRVVSNLSEEDGANFILIESDKCDEINLRQTYGNPFDKDTIAWDENVHAITWKSTKAVIAGPADAQAYRLQDGSMKPIVEKVFTKGEKVVLTGDEVTIAGTRYMQLASTEADQDIYVRVLDLTSEDEFSIVEDGQQIQKQFVLELVINGQVEISDIVVANSAEDLVYHPKNMGLITSVKIYVRDGKFALYSRPLTFEQNIQFMLFDGGDGSQRTPYLISSQAQLKNMQERNQSNYYFKLTKDIQVDLTDANLLQTFNGNLDGDGKTINLNLTGSYALENQISQLLPTSNINTKLFSITRAASLFGTIAANAVVKNINFAATVDVEVLEGESTAIALLCAINNGHIENINITSLTTKLKTTSRVLIALSGIAVENNKQIISCTNTADASLSVSSSNSNAPYISYAGIALKNNSNSDIDNCFSKGNISLSATKTGTMLWAAGIVALAAQNSRIRYCGTDMKISSTASSGISVDGFVAGIANYSLKADIDLSYNNAQLEAPSNFSIAGIVNIANGGSLTKLVDASGSAFANFVSGVSASSCYGSTRSSQLTLSKLEEITLTSGEYKLEVAQDADKFVAKIVKT